MKNYHLIYMVLIIHFILMNVKKKLNKLKINNYNYFNMNKKQKEDLLKAAEWIATEKQHLICLALHNVESDLDIYKDPVCKMFDPDTGYWWGSDTMGVTYAHP